MKTSFAILLSLIACISGQVIAQQPSPPPEKPPLPPGPLPKPPGEMAQWAVIYDASAAGAALGSDGTASSKDAAKAPPARTIVVTKTGTIYKIMETNSAGRTTVLWDVNGTTVSAPPDGTYSIVPNASIVEKGFSDLSWISEKNYFSAGKFAGVDCFVFKDRVLITNPLDDTAADRVEGIAVIDSTTLLPVFLQLGDSKRFYKLGSPPTTALQVPPAIYDLVSQRAKMVKGLTSRPQ
jgi:hypothetical protein